MKKFYLLLFCLAVEFANLHAQNRLDIDFKTGDDNLEKKEFQENPEVRIIVKDKPDIVKTNINYRGATWPNNSIRRVTIPLPNDVTVDELMEIHIHRRPIYSRGKIWDYLVKDNWTLKGLTVSATFKVNEQNEQYELLKLTPRGNVFRFIYEKGDSILEGTFFKAPLSVKPELVVKPEATLNAVLTAVIATGKDNLEGGNDNNVNLVLYLRNSPATITLENINRKMKWNGYSEKTVSREIPNSQELNLMDIERVVVKHTGGGGTFADNWDMTKFRLTISKGTQKLIIVNEARALIHRFTGEAREKSFNVVRLPAEVPPGKLTAEVPSGNVTITAVFGTGGDNLEGGNSNNVNLIIRFRNSSRPVSVTNVNNRAKWENNTIKTINNREIAGTADYDINDIEEVELKHTGGGGTFADNWNLDKFKLTITKGGQTRVLVDEVGAPVHRFTAEARKKEFLIQ